MLAAFADARVVKQALIFPWAGTVNIDIPVAEGGEAGAVIFNNTPHNPVERSIYRAPVAGVALQLNPALVGGPVFRILESIRS